MPTVELAAGPVEFQDSGGAGPVLVLVHGLLMDGAQWDAVVAELGGDFRCIRPTLPLGAHRHEMRPDADLTLPGLAAIVGDFLDALDLHDVALCFNDWCGAPVMIADGRVDRIGRLVLTSCEAFENYPPGWPGRLAALSGRLPGGIVVMRWTLLNRTLRKLPFTFGVMSKRGVPDAQMREWLAPLAQRAIRRDLRKYLRSTRGGRCALRTAIPAMQAFTRPVLVVWGSEDRMMPPEHGRRFVATFPNARLVELDDCYTLIPVDRPDALAAELRAFAATAPAD